jgi:hypothetical protein
MTNLKKYNKAIAAVGSAVVAVAAVAGFHIDPTVVTTIEGVLGSLLVYIVPNAS